MNFCCFINAILIFSLFFFLVDPMNLAAQTLLLAMRYIVYRFDISGEEESLILTKLLFVFVSILAIEETL